MYYNILVNGNMILCGGMEYELYADDLHKITISDVLYGSEDYDYLSDKLNTYLDIELECKNKTFAFFKDVKFNNVKYDLSKDSATFKGTFKEYGEDLKVIIDEFIG